MSAAPSVTDVDTTSFQAAVVDRSHEVPVVVDFWAEWCGPCHTLAPTLEAAVAARGGAVTLAKVDVDSNQDLAQRYAVRGIPAVKGFRDGEVVAEFVGAINAAQVEAFLDELTTEGPATEDTPGAPDVPEVPDEPDEETMRRLEDLSDRARESQDDGELLLTYGRALAETGFHTEAIEVLLHTVALGDDQRDEARAALVDLFDELGTSDPRVADGRRRLAASLF